MICPCGYDEECEAFWCGYGHYTGQCPPYEAADPRSRYEYVSEHLVLRELAKATPETSLNKRKRESSK